MMYRGSDVYRFGPFELNSAHRRLIRGPEPVGLPDRHLQILLVLVSNAGHIVTREALIEAVWRDVAVADSSVERAIWNLRKGGLWMPRRSQAIRLSAAAAVAGPRVSFAATYPGTVPGADL